MDALRNLKFSLWSCSIKAVSKSQTWFNGHNGHRPAFYVYEWLQPASIYWYLHYAFQYWAQIVLLSWTHNVTRLDLFLFFELSRVRTHQEDILHFIDMFMQGENISVNPPSSKHCKCSLEWILWQKDNAICIIYYRMGDVMFWVSSCLDKSTTGETPTSLIIVQTHNTEIVVLSRL